MPGGNTYPVGNGAVPTTPTDVNEEAIKRDYGTIINHGGNLPSPVEYYINDIKKGGNLFTKDAKSSGAKNVNDVIAGVNNANYIVRDKPKETPEDQWMKVNMPAIVEEQEKQKRESFLSQRGIIKNGKPIVPDTTQRDLTIHDNKKDYFTPSLVENPVEGNEISKSPVALELPFINEAPYKINEATDKIHQYFENELSKSDYDIKGVDNINKQNSDLIQQIRQIIPNWKPTVTPQEWKLYNDNSDSFFGTIGSEIHDAENNQPSILQGAWQDIKQGASSLANLTTPAGMALNMSQQAPNDPRTQLDSYKNIKKTYAKLWLLGQKPEGEDEGKWGLFMDNVKSGLSMDKFQTADQFVQGRDQLLRQAISTGLQTKNPQIDPKDLAEQTETQVKQLTSPQESGILDPTVGTMLAIGGGNMVGSLPLFLAASAAGGEAADIGKFTEKMTQSTNKVVSLAGRFTGATLRQAVPMSMLSKDKLSGALSGYAFAGAGQFAEQFGASISGGYNGAMKVLMKTAATASVHGASAAAVMSGMKVASGLLYNSQEFAEDLDKEGVGGMLSKEGKEFLANTILYGMLPIVGIHKQMREDNIKNGLKMSFDNDVALAPIEKQEAATSLKNDVEEVASKDPSPAVSPILETKNPNPPKASVISEGKTLSGKYTVPLGANEAVIDQKDFKGSKGSVIMVGDKIHSVDGDNHQAIFELRNKEMNGQQLNPKELETLSGLTGQDPVQSLKDVAEKASLDGNTGFAKQVKEHVEQMEANNNGTAHDNNIKALIKKYILTKQRNVPSNTEVNNAKTALAKYASTNGFEAKFEGDGSVSVSKDNKVISESNTDFERTKDAAVRLQKMITSESKTDPTKRKPEKRTALIRLAESEGLKVAQDKEGRVILKDAMGNTVMHPDDVYKGMKDYDKGTQSYVNEHLQNLSDSPQEMGDMNPVEVKKAVDNILSNDTPNHLTQKFLDAMQAKAGENIPQSKAPIPIEEPVRLVNDNEQTVKDKDMDEFLKNPVIPPKTEEPIEKEEEKTAIEEESEVKRTQVDVKKDIVDARKIKDTKERADKVASLQKELKDTQSKPKKAISELKEAKDRLSSAKKIYKDKVTEMKEAGQAIDPDDRRNPLFKLSNDVIQAEGDIENLKSPIKTNREVKETPVSPMYLPLVEGIKSGTLDKVLSVSNLGDYMGLKPDQLTYNLQRKGVITESEETKLNKIIDDKAYSDVKKTNNKQRVGGAGNLSSTIIPFLDLAKKNSEGTDGLINKGFHAAIEAYNKNTKFKDFVKNFWGAASTTTDEEEQIKPYRVDVKLSRMLQYAYEAAGALQEGRFSKFTGLDRMGAEDFKEGEEHVIYANNKYRDSVILGWDASKGDPDAFRKYMVNSALKLQAEGRNTPAEKATLYASSKMLNLAYTARTPDAVNTAVEMITGSVRYRYGDNITSPNFLHEKSVLDEISKQQFTPLNNEEYENLKRVVYGEDGDPYKLQRESRVDNVSGLRKYGQWIDDFYRHPQFLYAIAKTEAGRKTMMELYKETQKGMVREPQYLQEKWTKSFMDIDASLNLEQKDMLSKVLHLGKYWDEKEYTPEELKNGLTLPDKKTTYKPDDKTIQAYADFRDLIKEQQDKIIDGEKLKKQTIGMPDETAEGGISDKLLYHHEMTPEQQTSWEEQKRKDLFGVNGYSPFERQKDDNHIVIGTGKDYIYKTGSDRKHVFKFPSADKAELFANHLRSKGFSNVATFEKSQIPRASLNDINVTDLTAIKDAIVKGRDESELNPQETLAMKNIDDAIRDVQVSRNRGNKLQFKAVPGIEPNWKNLVYSMNNMINRESVSYGNTYAKYKQEGLIQQFPSQDNNLQGRAKSWIDSINKKGQTSGVFDKLSALVYANRLMLNPTHVMRVFASTFYMAPMTLHLDSSPLITGEGNAASYAKEHAKALAYAMQFTRDKQGLISDVISKTPILKNTPIIDPKTLKSSDMYGLMDRMHMEGTFSHNSAQYAMSLMFNKAADEAGSGSFVMKGLNRLADKGAPFLNKAMNQSIMNVEYFARAQAGYLGLMDAKARGLTDPEKMVDHATRIVFRSNANYDKTNQLLIRSHSVNSVLLRGITSSMLLFKNTHMNHNELMTDVLGDMGKQMLAGHFLSKEVGRGLGAATYEGIGMGLSNFINPVSLTLKMGNAISTGMQKSPITTAALMASAAAMYMAATHKENQPNLTPDEIIQKEFKDKPEVADVLSHGFYAAAGLESGNINDLGTLSIGGDGNILDAMPATAMIHNWYKSVQAQYEGDKYGMIKDLTPSFFQNGIKAQRWENNPLTISKGVTYKNDRTKALEQLSGLQPLSYSKAYDAKRLESDFKTYHDAILKRVQNTGTASSDDIDEYNSDLTERLSNAYEQSGATINEREFNELVRNLKITPKSIVEARKKYVP